LPAFIVVRQIRIFYFLCQIFCDLVVLFLTYSALFYGQYNIKLKSTCVAYTIKPNKYFYIIVTTLSPWRIDKNSWHSEKLMNSEVITCIVR